MKRHFLEVGRKPRGATSRPMGHPAFLLCAASLNTQFACFSPEPNTVDDDSSTHIGTTSHDTTDTTALTDSSASTQDVPGCESSDLCGTDGSSVPDFDTGSRSESGTGTSTTAEQSESSGSQEESGEGTEANDRSLRVVGLTPTSDADPMGAIVIEFSEPIDESTINTSSVHLSTTSGTLVGGLTVDQNIVTWTPTARMPLASDVTIQLGSAIRSADGSALPSRTHVQSIRVRDGSWHPPQRVTSVGTSFFLGADALGGATIVVHVPGEGDQPDELWSTRLTGGAWSALYLVEREHSISDVALASSHTGHNALKWTVYDGTQSDVWSTHTTESGWSSPERVESGPGFSTDEAIGIDGDGNILVVWGSQQPRQLMMNRFDAGRDSWSGEELIAELEAETFSVDLAMNTIGSAALTWTQTNAPRDRIFGALYETSAGWSTPQLLDTSGDSWPSEPAINEDGTAIIIWSQQANETSYFWSNHTTANGSWGAPEIFWTRAEASRTVARTSVALNEDGQALAAWTEPHGSSFQLWARSLDLTEGWDTATQINDDASFGDHALDAHGNGFLIYWTYNGDGALSVRRYNSHTSTWGDPITLSELPDGGGPRKLEVRSDGTAIAAWSSSFDAHEDQYGVWIAEFR